SAGICAYWRSRKSIGINCASEGIDALYHCACRFIDFENRAALAGIIKKSVGQCRVVYRLPEQAGRTSGKPIRIKRPHLNQRATLPGVFVLVPFLRAVSAVA